MQDEDAVIRAVLAVVRPAVLEEFAADSCVATTRIAIDVLDHFGVRAEPLPVSVAIFNAAAWQVAEQTGSLDEVARVVQAADADAEGGPWSLGLGAPIGPRSSRRAGHVVVMLRARQEFLDLSLDQASRPRKRMHLEPSRFTVAAEDWRFFTKPGTKVVYTTEDADPADRCVLMYEHDRSALYRASPNWRRQSGARDAGVFARVTARAIEAVSRRV